MKPHLPHWTLEQRQAIALDLLTEKDTLAGLAHEHHVSIHQILGWKEDLVRALRHGRRLSAA